jgi:hypothetical protein
VYDEYHGSIEIHTARQQQARDADGPAARDIVRSVETRRCRLPAESSDTAARQ